MVEFEIIVKQTLRKGIAVRLITRCFFGTREFVLAAFGVVIFSNVMLAENGIVQDKGESPMTMSLGGEWAFRLDPDSVGLKEKWHSERLPGTAILPGSLDEQKLGIKNSKRQINRLTREYEYVGPAWYQKEIAIPGNWEDKRVILLLERCHWETRVWINDHDLGAENSLSVPHIYDLTEAIQPGKNKLTIRVDNTLKINIGHTYGNAMWTHAITDETQTNWNGIIGRIELRGTPKVWIESVQAYPDFDKRITKIKTTIGNFTGLPVEGMLDISDITDGASVKAIAFTAGDRKTMIEAEMPFTANPTLWDEFSPLLHQLDIVLSAKTEKTKFSHRHSTYYALRNFIAEGQHFKLNDRTIFLRGNLDCCVFPKTGYPPMTVKEWKDYLGIMKDYGMNHIRFHSWCPPEAAFTAADELGMIFQIEPPLWDGYGLVGSDINRAAYILREADRIVDTYGNHPSFCLMSMGNELGEGNDPYLAYLVDYLKNKDARRLYTSTTHPSDMARKDDFFVSAATPNGGTRGDIAFRDFRDSLLGYDRPLIAHEVGQPAMYPDYDEISKYTGHLKAYNLQTFKDSLEQRGMSDMAKKFHRASGRLLVDLYKEFIEAQLRTPTMAGFQLLGLQDFSGQGTALIGVLDAFCDSKRLISPEEFRQFNGSTVPLIRMKGYIWTADEVFTAAVEVAHYGPLDMNQQGAVWRVKDAEGRTVSSGNFEAKEIPTGAITELGTIECKLDKVAVPAKLTLEVALPDTEFENAWNFWVYPQEVDIDMDDMIYVTDKWDAQARETLTHGGKVLLFPPPKTLVRVEPSRWYPVFWSVQLFAQQPETMGILCDPEHPVFDRFPTDFYGSWQWRDPLNRSESLVLDEMESDLRPLIQFVPDFNRNRKMAALMEAQVGQGRLMICMMDLQSDLETRPVARQLLSSIIHYMKSDRFSPPYTLSTDDLNRLLERRSNLEMSGTPAGISKAALHVKASRSAPVEQSRPWSRDTDDIVKQEEGFDYRIQGQSWRDAGGAAWYESRLVITVECPVGFEGEFYVHFHDWNGQERAASLYFTGHDLGPLSRYDGEGVWIRIPVTKELSSQGRLNLDARTTGGPNVMVSQIVLIPKD